MSTYETIWYLAFPLVGIHFFLLHLIYARLKERHSHTYRDLGQPTVFNLSFIKSGKILKYLYTLKYLRSGDGKLITLCHIDNLVALVFYIILLWPFIAAFWETIR